MIVLARLFLPRVLMIVTRLGSGELLLVVSAALALGAAWLTGWLGFTPEMGAFLAGFMLASTPFRYQLSGQIGPVRDILVALFFTLVGTQVDIAAVVQYWWVVLLAVPALMIGKVVLVGVSGWLLGIPAAPSFLTGVYVANGSEFSLVLLGAGLAAGVLSEVQAALAEAVVFFTLIICPLLAGPSHRLVPMLAVVRSPRWIKASPLPPARGLDPDTRGPCHVVIAGFGPVGRAIADELSTASIPFTVIELNRAVQRQDRPGPPDCLRRCHQPRSARIGRRPRADAIIITVPDDEVSLRPAARQGPGAQGAHRGSVRLRQQQAQGVAARGRCGDGGRVRRGRRDAPGSDGGDRAKVWEGRRPAGGEWGREGRADAECVRMTRASWGMS